MYLREGKTGGAIGLRNNYTNANSVVSNAGSVPKET